MLLLYMNEMDEKASIYKKLFKKWERSIVIPFSKYTYCQHLKIFHRAFFYLCETFT